MASIKLSLSLIGVTGLLLAGCGTTPTSAQVPSSTFATQSLAAGQYAVAEASGRIGAWASGTLASTTPDGSSNTFSDNLQAWSQTHLGGGQLLAPHLGAGVTVAVIDTGLDLKHPQFQGHLAPAADWYDFLGADSVAQEEGDSSTEGYGHGTAVASLMLQVAPHATILPLRVIAPNGTASADTVARAIDYAVAHGADVINLSIVSGVDSTLSTAIGNAAAKGIYVTMAAGNQGTNPVMYPSRFAGQNSTLGQYSLSVGSIETSNVQSDFSNYGNQLEVLAPGRLLTTAYPNQVFAQVTGTSFASPVVAGTLALALGEALPSRYTGLLANKLEANETNVSQYNAQYLVDGALPYGLLNTQSFVKSVLR